MLVNVIHTDTGNLGDDPWCCTAHDSSCSAGLGLQCTALAWKYSLDFLSKFSRHTVLDWTENARHEGLDVMKSQKSYKLIGPFDEKAYHGSDFLELLCRNQPINILALLLNEYTKP